MKSKPLEYVVQGFLVDEDDAGGVVGKVALEPRTFPAGVALAMFRKHLADVDRLAGERSAERSLQNRAARRRQAKTSRRRKT